MTLLDVITAAILNAVRRRQIRALGLGRALTFFNIARYFTFRRLKFPDIFKVLGPNGYRVYLIYLDRPHARGGGFIPYAGT